MEDKFYNDDFEKFLQEQVKNHKMFPSDKIWRNINNSIHPDYKWPALTIAAFAFLAATIAISVYFSPGPNIFAIDNTAVKPAIAKSTAKKGSPLLTTNYPGQKGFSKTISSNSLADVIAEEVATERQSAQTPSLQVDSESSSTNPRLNSTPQDSKPDNNSEAFNVASVLNKEEIAGQEQANFLYGDIAKELRIFSKSEQLKMGPLARNAFAVPAKKTSKASRWDYSVYITPSAGFRKLKEDKSATIKQSFNVGGPVALGYISTVNDVVRHKPGTGMEAGFNVGYKIGKKLKVRSGLQLNARQYNIEAFLSTTDVATIAFISGNGVDSMTTYSSYRTSSGYEATELANQYYQVSIPIALEYEVGGTKNIKLNVAAGIQPTYMISDNAYLISSDFRNYVENPEMTRKWNMNANLETFLSIKSGSYKWQVGPQFRYQLRPTSVDKYPIREYLMDYGLKVGVTKSLK